MTNTHNAPLTPLTADEMNFLSDALDEFDEPCAHETRDRSMVQHSTYEQRPAYMSCPPDEASDPMVRLPMKSVSAICAQNPAKSVKIAARP